MKWEFQQLQFRPHPMQPSKPVFSHLKFAQMKIVAENWITQK